MTKTNAVPTFPYELDVRLLPRERRYFPGKWIPTPSDPRRGGYMTRGYWNMTQREYDAKPRLYIWVEGETIAEQLFTRRVRPVEMYRYFARAALEQLGAPAGVRLNWSQYAGCSCPCSPGFIVTGLPTDGQRFDISMNVKVNEADLLKATVQS